MNFFYVNINIKASLENISKKFILPKNSDCIILALGCSIPEMTTNILSVFDSEKETFNYGFGAIVGSGVFGIHYLIRFYYVYRNCLIIFTLLSQKRC